MKGMRKIKYDHFYHKTNLRTLLITNGFRIEKEADFHTASVNHYLTGKKG